MLSHLLTAKPVNCWVLVEKRICCCGLSQRWLVWVTSSTSQWSPRGTPGPELDPSRWQF